MEVREEPCVVRHRLTADEYHRMGEVGVLAPDARVELIDGEVIDMAPMGNRHRFAVMVLGKLLHTAVGERAQVSSQLPIRLSDDTEPEPDLALLRPRADFYRDAIPTGHDTLLVIEVADSTLAYDVHIKARLYALHGVPELWIVDIPGSQLRRFRLPKGDAWSEVDVLPRPGRMALPGLLGQPEAAIDLRLLFEG